MSTNPLDCVGKQHTYYIDKKRDQHCSSDARGAWKDCLYLWCPERLQTIPNPVTLSGPQSIPHQSQEQLIQSEHGLQTSRVRKPNITPTPSPRPSASHLPAIQVVQEPTAETVEESERETTSKHEETLEEQPPKMVVHTEEPTGPSGDKGKQRETTPEEPPVFAPIQPSKVSFEVPEPLYGLIDFACSDDKEPYRRLGDAF